MFVITLNYVVDLTVVDSAIEQHASWLQQQYEAGVFVLSGARVPRTGGVILATGVSLPELEQLIRSDPFHQLGYAEYAITEFVPTRSSAELSVLVSA